jgi:hypothetical protein
MKTQEEIEQLAEKWCTNVIDTAKNKQSDSALIRHILASSEKLAYKDGYTQCQEDMADKMSDLLAWYMVNKGEQYRNETLFVDVVKDYINSLNKQD